MMDQLRASPTSQQDPRTIALLTVPQAAQQAGVSLDTIRAWIRSGALPSQRINGRRRIHPDALAATQEAAHAGDVVPAWRANPSRAGQRLRQLREAAGLSQLALAARSALTHETICSLEGGRRAPLAETIHKLAQGLGVPAARFVGHEPVGLSLLTVAEAAARLGVPPPRVQAWVKAGELPGTKVSGQWRVPAVAVAQLGSSGRLRGQSRRLDPRYRG